MSKQFVAWARVSSARQKKEGFSLEDQEQRLIEFAGRLGGSVVEVAVSGSCGAAIVADATLVNATSLVTFDPVSGAPIAAASQSPLATVGADGGFYLQGSLWLNGDLYIGDRRRATDGYPVHALSSTAACALEIQPDAIFLPQPPVAVRAPD